MEMLQALPTDYTTFHCTNEVDESGGNQKWSKAAAAQLKRLIKDCNLTAGLESDLHIAVGGRVMLRRNLDTSAGVMNGSLCTVVSFTTQCIVEQFDKIAYTTHQRTIHSEKELLCDKTTIPTDSSFCSDHSQMARSDFE